MANKKISDLSAATLALTSLLEVESAGGTSGKTTAADVLNLRWVVSSSDPTVNDDTGDGYEAYKTCWFNSSTRNRFICTDHTSTAAVWLCLNPNLINLATNDYYAPYTDSFFSTGACAANVLRLIEFRPAQRMTVDQLGLLVHTAAGGVNFKCGIWASNGKTIGNILSSSTSGPATSQQAMLTALSSAITLDPARTYWYGDVHDGALDKVSHQSCMNRLQGATGLTHIAQGISNRGWHYSVSFPTYSAAFGDLTAMTGVTKVTAFNSTAGPGVPVFRVSNIAP